LLLKVLDNNINVLGFLFFGKKIIIKSLGEASQNFLQKFVRFFVTLGLKILRLLRLKVVFEAKIIKG